MLFHMEKYGDKIEGWLSPDNPGTAPRIRIIRPDGSVAELETNVFRPDVRDCPSSDDLRLIRRLAKGGSGASGVEFKRPAVDAARSYSRKLVTA